MKTTVALNKKPYTAEEREAGRAILRYLAEHPDAKDTLEGITQWWIGGESSKHRYAERAVSFLMSEGLILETRRKGLRPYYQLRPKATRGDTRGGARGEAARSTDAGSGSTPGDP